MINKTDNVFFWFCLILLLLLGYQRYQLKKIYKTFLNVKSEKNILLKKLLEVDKFNARELLPVEIQNKKSDTLLVKIKNSDYAIIIVIGKLNCNFCISEISNLVQRIDCKRVYISAVLYYNKDDYIKKYQEEFMWDYPIISGDFTKWYEKHDLIVGPSIFLVDGKSGMSYKCIR